jgi:hypothetical protein
MNCLPEYPLEYLGVDPDQYVKLFEVGNREIYGIVVLEDQDPTDLWHRLYALHRTRHFWPLILGTRQAAESLGNVLAYNTQERISEAIRKSMSVDLHQWFGNRAKQVIENIFDPKPADEILFSPLESPSIFGHFGEVVIGLIPQSKGWDLPSIFGLDGSIWKPDPFVESAIFRRWNERYGADVFAFYEGTISLVVRRPPLSQSASLNIASELFLYFPDRIPHFREEKEMFIQNLIGRHCWLFDWGYPSMM